MSDGMSDANAEGDLARAVWCAAFDLREAIWALDRAIKQARMGHRGWNIPRGFIVSEVNDLFRETSFVLVDQRPDKCFEHYGPRAYERSKSWHEKELERELEARDKEIQKLQALLDGAYI